MDSSQPIPVPTIFGDDIAGFVTLSNCWVFTTYSYEPSYWMLLKREGFSGGLVSDSSELDSLTNQLSREDLTTLYRIHYKTDPDHYFTISLREDVEALILSSQIKVFKLSKDLFPRLTDANDVLYSSRQHIFLSGTDIVTAKRNELAEELGYDISTRWLTKDKADKLHWDRGLITREAYELYDVGAKVADTAVDFVVSLYQIGKAVIIITGKTFKVVGEFYFNIATGDLEGIRKDLEAIGIWVGDTIDNAEKLTTLAKQGLEIFNQLQNDPQSRDLIVDYFSSLYESIPYRDSRTISVRIVTEIGIEVLLAIATVGVANVARRAGQAGVSAARIGSTAERIGPFTKRAIELLSDLAKRLNSKNISSEKLPPPKNLEIPEHAKNKNLDGGVKDSTIAYEEVVPNSTSVIDDAATQSLKGKYARRTDVSYRAGDDVNSTFPSGWEPPYKPGTRVTEFNSTVDDVYVRVHGETNKARSWMMKREALDGLTPQQIQSKYALPELPTFMSEVNVPAGTRIRTGTVNPVFDGVGNATQYELLQRLPESVFQNTLRLGQ